MASDRLHSKLIVWLKVFLPLVALAILSSVVFFARGTEEERRIPFVSVEGDEFERERIERPEYLAVTADGDALRITAREVVPAPDATQVYIAESVTGRIETDEGRIIQATAPEGRLDMDGDLADLLGIVSVDTSDGFHVLTENLRARLDVTYIESGGAVRGEAPFGRIEAGGMRFAGDAGDGGVLHFTGGVKVIYEPRN